MKALLGTIGAWLCLVPFVWAQTPETIDVLKAGTGPQIESDQMLFGSMIFLITQSDSVLYDSRQQPGTPTQLYYLDSVATPNSFMEALGYLHIGDSCRITVTADKFFGEYAQRPIPPTMTAATQLSFVIGVDSAISREALIQRQLTQQLVSVAAQFESKMTSPTITAQVEAENDTIEAYLLAKGLTVATTKYGVRVVITEEGSGEPSQNGDFLSMRYAGQLLDGNYFDTNDETLAREQGMYRSGRPYQPFEFQLLLGSVISGWHVGLEGLPVGTKAILLIPSPLAYGERGSPPIIPASAPLRFDVEILGIRKPF
ncbi:MAG: FKBP-type peptidyl-prolyl cis-trans isomerase [Bacteroidota bacterium]